MALFLFALALFLAEAPRQLLILSLPPLLLLLLPHTLFLPQAPRHLLVLSLPLPLRTLSFEPLLFRQTPYELLVGRSFALEPLAFLHTLALFSFGGHAGVLLLLLDPCCQLRLRFSDSLEALFFFEPLLLFAATAKFLFLATLLRATPLLLATSFVFLATLLLPTSFIRATSFVLTSSFVLEPSLRRSGRAHSQVMHRAIRWRRRLIAVVGLFLLCLSPLGVERR
ncbi:hypothetical protein JCM5296_001259 [Sporobolomyces johnsonii]